MCFALQLTHIHPIQQLMYKNRKTNILPTARGVPRRSPIQVLTAPDVAWLQWSDENWYVQRGMAVDTNLSSVLAICLTWNLRWKLSLPVRFRTLHPLYTSVFLNPLYLLLHANDASIQEYLLTETTKIFALLRFIVYLVVVARSISERQKLFSLRYL